MSNRFTPWFDGSDTPARRGLYQRRFWNKDIVFSYFDGRYWYLGSVDEQEAMQRFREKDVSLAQATAWRGLAQKPA